MQNKPGYLRGGILGTVAAAIVALAAGAANAEFPDKPITFIVPYSPGGGSDQQARRLQPGLQKELGVEIRIVYKTGGGGAVGFNELWRSEPDGYTISNVVVPNIVISAQGKDVGFKPGEFSYIGMTAKAVGVILVPKGSELNTLEKFVAAAKANPGKLTTAGVGKMMPMLQGNHVDAGITSSTHAVRHAATVDPIVTAGPDTAIAGIPNEPGWGYTTTWGVMAPPGTPADRIAILNAALNKVTADPQFKANVEKVGLRQMRMTPEEAKAYVEAAVKKYSK